MTIFGDIMIFECSLDLEHILNVISTGEPTPQPPTTPLQFSGYVWIDYHIWNCTWEDYLFVFVYIYCHFNNPTNMVYKMQKRPCHLDQNWQSYVEIFILVKIDMLNIFIFGLFICICLHILSF